MLMSAGFAEQTQVYKHWNKLSRPAFASAQIAAPVPLPILDSVTDPKPIVDCIYHKAEASKPIVVVNQ